ncbi:MAG TPA: FtsX-like permease family protein [Solirubrobacteraceae bacterium]|jgi:putative ABC transport system permease protein|nr:FtsX-like permease family protein [Solirubrobacteraceae bacterium]
MTRVALKGLLGRKLRASLTAVAIVLGVAMVSGTYILTDTIKSAFSTVFTQVYKNTDAVVTGKSAIGGDQRNNASLPPSLPASLLTRIRGLPGVAQTSGGVSDRAQLVGHNGKVISRGGAPALGFSYDPAGQRFNPLTLTGGTWPSGPGQVAIDASTASRDGFSVGQEIGVIALGPEQLFRIVGTVKFGGVSSLGGATMAVFTLPVAQQIFRKQGRLDSISVAAKSGVSPAQLVREIRPLLGPSAVVRTGQAQAQKASNDTNGFLNIFQSFLLAFGGVALFVGSFVIANTLSITIAQRTRELATLRALGATRRQVLRSVMIEALVIGLLAAIAGLFLGLALAKGLNSLLVSVGIDLPQASTVFATRTVIVSLLVGVLITLAAALRPAVRSTRVPPIAAVREGAVLPPTRLARFGAYPALATTAGALALMLVGLLVGTLSTTQRLLAIGVGAAVLFIGVAMLAPRLVPPVTRVLGWPATKVGGSAGALARGNVARNPARTASTAAALMIGLALVTLVGVLAAGLRTRFENSVNSVFVANYALTSTDNFTPISTASSGALTHVPGVQVVSGVRGGQGRAFGSRINVTGVAPNVSEVISVKWQAGSPQTPGLLGFDGAFVSKDYANSHHLHVGSPLSLETPTGATLHLTLRGIIAPPKGASPYGDVTISTTRFDQAYPNPQNLYTFVNVQGGVTAANTRRLESALSPFPDAKIQTKSQFKDNQLHGLTLLLNLLYVLLSLSIVVSLFGIVNTLVLTVFERTRELGMLRAVGMTRRQVRTMIREESVITALLGATLGIPLGVLLALMVGVAIKYAAFTIPWGTLVVFLVAAVVVGIVAAIFPARRAGRLNVLQALQYE